MLESVRSQTYISLLPPSNPFPFFHTYLLRATGDQEDRSLLSLPALHIAVFAQHEYGLVLSSVGQFLLATCFIKLACEDIRLILLFIDELVCGRGIEEELLMNGDEFDGFVALGPGQLDVVPSLDVALRW